MAKTSYTQIKLAGDLKRLGVRPGDTLFVHSSFNSLGPVESGAGAVIGAMEDVLGPWGLLLMPSFNLVQADRRPDTWNIHRAPSTVGWLTEYFRQMPGTHRSDHYSHSVAALGEGARAFVSEHLSRRGYGSPWDCEPWGKTYGWRSPMYRAYRGDGRLLMLGVDYEPSTYVHLVEVIYWNRRLRVDSQSPYRWLKRPALGAHWDRVGEMDRGRVGDADCRLFGIQDFVDALLKEVERDSQPYLR